MPNSFLDLLPDLDANSIFSGASAIAALLSALYASTAARSAAKSAAIAEVELSQKNDGILAELIDGISWKDSDDRSMVAFACTLINRAVAPSSISKIELHVHEFDTSGQTSKLILTPCEPKSLDAWALEALPNNINISERATISGWVSFHIPTIFSEKKQIDRYELKFISSLGSTATVEQYIIRKIEDGTNRS